MNTITGAHESTLSHTTQKLKSLKFRVLQDKAETCFCSCLAMENWIS